MAVNEELRVALDIGAKKHRVGIANADGKIVDEFDITHDQAGFDQFFRRIEARRKGEPVVVAMEGLNGWARPLDRLIQKSDYELLNVNNVKLARFKEIFPAPAKTDKIDTRKTLELIHMRKLLPLGKRVLHSVHPAPVENEQLKRYTRRRQQLVEERTRVINRLQSDVQAVVPGLLEITADAANLWFLNLLTAREDLTKLATMRRSSLLKIRGVGATYADKIEQWQASATFSDEVAWTGPMIIADAERVIELIRQIQALEKVMESVAATSNIACRIQSIPGFGPVLSATFAGEIGALDRFPAEGSLALYSGMTMLDNSSGQFAGSKNTRQVNTHMRRAMMIGVARHMESVPQSRAYYDKKRAEGKTHNQAVRALGRQLIRVIWSMLRNDRNYVNQQPIPEPAC